MFGLSRVLLWHYYVIYNESDTNKIALTFALTLPSTLSKKEKLITHYFQLIHPYFQFHE